MVYGGLKRQLIDLLKNPLTEWFLWYIKSRITIIQNSKNNIRIGYLTDLYNVELGIYNTFASNVSISNSKIEDFVYIARGTRIANAKIGKFCSIGPDVKIGLGKHPPHFISTFPAFFSTSRQCQITFTKENHYTETEMVSIGNDVWIGANAILLDGISVGDGAIIAAGAVVAKNVAPYSIVGGVPASLIKKRFSDDMIKRLIDFRWWDKDTSWLKKNHQYFNEPDAFFETFLNEPRP